MKQVKSELKILKDYLNNELCMSGLFLQESEIKIIKNSFGFQKYLFSVRMHELKDEIFNILFWWIK